jgi:uncharacterized protein
VVVFVLVAVAIVVLIHVYVWKRLVRDTTRDRRWRRLGAVVVLVAALLAIGNRTFADRVPPALEDVLAWPGQLWVIVLMYLVLVLAALELPVLVASLVLRRRATAAVSAPAPELAAALQPAAPGPVAAGPPQPELPPPPVADETPDHDPDRRLLLRRGAAITAGLVATGVTGFGVSRAYAPPTIKRLDIPLPRLDPRADGLRVAVLADIHAGPLLGRRQVQRVVDLVNGLDADLVTVVGDMVSSEVDRVRESLVPLAGMRSRHGSYFVSGNHEYYVGHEAWYEATAEMGLRVLRNERVEIVHRGGAIDLAGVTDITGGRYDDPPDYRAALGDRDRSRPVVLMAHQPVAVHDAAPFGVDLQLSGHTHGGQIYPFHYVVARAQPVLSGLGEVDGIPVYVTNGTGFFAAPVRVGADPDITLLTLRSR